MELELKKEQFACCWALPPLNNTHEETAETIVPDYLPDIGRIVDVCGCLLLRSREIVNGRASVSGLLRMTLLYVAEDGQGLKSFAYTLPLEHTMDGRILDGAADSCLEGRLCSCEVRLLNPRKILTRASVDPFSLEVDQTFIGAILTVIGYSINDKVVVFDRIRENLQLHKKIPLGLAVEPDDGLRGTGVKLVAFDGNTAAC